MSCKKYGLIFLWKDRNKNMNILVTGGAGFIGSQIVNQLYKHDNISITVLDILSEQIHGDNPEDSYLYKRIKGKCRFIRGDIRDYSIVRDSMKKCDVIIHLAAETGTGQSMYEINQYNEVNIMGTSNIFQAVLSMGVRLKKFVLASSRSVYGEGRYMCSTHGHVYPKARAVEDMRKGDFSMHCPVCNKGVKLVSTTEDSKVVPGSLYAFTKHAQEELTRTMCQAFGIPYTIFRLQNVYGVGQSLKNPYTGILSIFSALLLENKPLNIFEDGLESRDFVNVKDVVIAIINSLTNDETNGEIINLGSGVGTSVLKIAESLKKIYTSDSPIQITGDFRIGDIAHNIADIQKAKSLMGFCPTISLENGLQEFALWVMGQDRDNSGYEKSLNEMEQAGLLIRTEAMRK